MTQIQTIKQMIINKINTHNNMINIYLKLLDENKISDDDLSLNVEVAKEQTLKRLLKDIIELEGFENGI
jgi:hypothetical protein